MNSKNITKVLHYNIHINATREYVWNTMLDKTTWNDWNKAFSPNSMCEGEFAEGAEVRYTDPPNGGTKVIIEIFAPHHKLLEKHVAVINNDGTEDTEGDFAKEWVGTTVEYVFSDSKGGTTMEVNAHTSEQVVGMFDECFPNALVLLKQLCES